MVHAACTIKVKTRSNEAMRALRVPIGRCLRDAIPFDSQMTTGMAFAFLNLHFVRCDRGE